jgi:hypothetical protein
MPNFGACRCGTRWHQAGNKTGHCGGCHRTFSGTRTFDAHQTLRDGKNVCADPAALLDKAGEARFRTYVDTEGATVWRTVEEQAPGTWPGRARSGPNQCSVPLDQPRTGAGGTPEPVALPDAPNGGTAR